MGIFGYSLPAGCGTLPGEEPEPPCCNECEKDECTYLNPEKECPELSKLIKELGEEDRKASEAQCRDLIEAKKLVGDESTSTPTNGNSEVKK